MRFSALASSLPNCTLTVEKPPHPGLNRMTTATLLATIILLTCSPWSNWGALLGRRPRVTHPRVQADTHRVARCHNLRYHQLSQKVHNAPGNRFSACTLWVATQYMTRYVPFLTRSQQRATLCTRTFSARHCSPSAHEQPVVQASSRRELLHLPQCERRGRV